MTMSNPVRLDVFPKSLVLLSAAFFLLIGIVYFPVVTSEYGFYDDYYYLNVADSDLSGADLFKIGARQGRPLTGVAFAVSMGLVDNVSELNYLRLIGVVFTAIFGVSFFLMLTRFGWSVGLSLLLALLVALLPAFQVYVSWSVCFILPAGALLGLFSGYCWTRHWHSCGEAERNGSRSRLIVASISVALAMAIYQPAAMMVWCFPAVYLLFGQNTTVRNEIRFVIGTGVFVACAMVFGFLLLKLGVSIFGAHGDARGGLVSDVFAKVGWFINEPLRDVIVPWQLGHQLWLSLACLAFVSVGFYGLSDWKWLSSCRKLGWLLVLLVLAYLPNLLSAENWTSFRTQIAIGSIMSIAIIGGLEGWRRIVKGSRFWPICCGFCLLVVVLSAQQNIMRGFVLPQSTEWAWLKSQVREIVSDNQVDLIYVVGSDWRYSIAERVYYDEFGLPSSAQPWMPVPMLRLAIKELGMDPNSFELNRIDPAEVELTEAAPFPQIDFRDISHLR